MARLWQICKFKVQNSLERMAKHLLARVMTAVNFTSLRVEHHYWMNGLCRAGKLSTLLSYIASWKQWCMKRMRKFPGHAVLRCMRQAMTVHCTLCCLHSIVICESGPTFPMAIPFKNMKEILKSRSRENYRSRNILDQRKIWSRIFLVHLISMCF